MWGGGRGTLSCGGLGACSLGRLGARVRMSSNIVDATFPIVLV